LHLSGTSNPVRAQVLRNFAEAWEKVRSRKGNWEGARMAPEICTARVTRGNKERKKTRGFLERPRPIRKGRPGNLIGQK